MKKLWSIGLAGTVILISACAQEDETVEEPADAPSMEENEAAESDSEEKAPTIPYIKFDLEVDYEGTENDFELEYEVDKNVEAVYEDQRNALTLAGDDAYQEIEPVLSEFDFTADTPDEEIVQAVIEKFEIEEGFDSIEIEVAFEDGTEKEIEQTNE
ncbi:YusW family protein [Jeotgalibacillus sp. ET6]|uniref:YusW family protein n=1 Tax=Jeotgalibacillus sp. ET6 TaxID=3037260 RepID=UPI00241832C2|nr:YusW family protein [Jeotgalibacillus sp. ET6]MDG5471027.1 YusW family protein [Jeotgalibacillus sp. ET6]